jgi:hypothetical protein
VWLNKSDALRRQEVVLGEEIAEIAVIGKAKPYH